MSHRYIFDRSILHSVAGGKSALDIPRLNIRTIDAADAFIKSYGFDLSKSEINEKTWYFHRRAIVLLTEKMGYKLEDIPDEIKDPKKLEDIRQLLLYASSTIPQEKELQKWACAVLRCMHVFVHTENDLFSTFSEEIQSQILTPFHQVIFLNGNTHSTVLKSKIDPSKSVELLGFYEKPFKTSLSTVIKLLAKPEALAMRLLDKLGVRFVTKNLFDTFQVLRFLVEEDIMSFAHIMPDQSSNNLYPVDLFVEICEELRQRNTDISDEEINKLFEQRLEQSQDKDKLFRKENKYTSDNYRFIKFITRKLIHIKVEGKEQFSFFYPYEIQIMDKKAFETIQSGPAEHMAYKERQLEAAKKRIFPEVNT